MHTSTTRWMLALVVALCGASALPLPAQEREGGVPRDVMREIAALFNDPATRRERGEFTLPATDTIRTTLVVLDGPAQINGVVLGHLVVVNGDATLGNAARISRDVTVVGGTLSAPAGTVTGETRTWRARMPYHMQADSLVPDPESDIALRLQRWRLLRTEDGNSAELFLTTAHTYNRVEGLPIYFGPRARARTGETRYELELLGIFRTADGFEWERENLGHRVKLEIRRGQRRGVSLSGRLFDEVDAIERWQLGDGEVGLEAFLFSRDYRDYWNRHGGEASIGVFGPRRNALSVSFGEERWTSRRARDPWTLFNGKLPWRINPLVDEGVVNVVRVQGILDTRNDLRHPRTGWFLTGQYERGSGSLTPPNLTPLEPLVARDVEYGRVFFDLRRYNRLGPGANLNFRAVFGGWLHGDPLPQQRRLSVSGVDALPGYDFRRLLDEDSFDVGTCVQATNEAYAAIGRPANCQRMVLLQAEWKGDFRVQVGDRDHGDERWYTSRFDADGNWVLFVNSGRGWLIGDETIAGAYRKESIPSMRTWRTDIGGGLDVGVLGLYVAKSVTDSGEPLNFFVRLGRRF